MRLSGRTPRSRRLGSAAAPAKDCCIKSAVVEWSGSGWPLLHDQRQMRCSIRRKRLSTGPDGHCRSRVHCVPVVTQTSRPTHVQLVCFGESFQPQPRPIQVAAVRERLACDVARRPRPELLLKVNDMVAQQLGSIETRWVVLGEPRIRDSPLLMIPRAGRPPRAALGACQPAPLNAAPTADKGPLTRRQRSLAAPHAALDG